MKTKKLHMIGNAHLDPVWLWQWQDGFHEAIATFRSALDRMQEYPDFIFVSSSAAIYEWVEQSDPAMFAEIQQRVAQGRWKIVGGWWIEPDCNIPGGESFVRQGLYGQHYFQEKFGITASVGYNVDSFGHHAMLPQILKKSGMPYYIFMRPSPHEKGLPSRLFWWESDDGSRVLAFRIAFEYCSWGRELDKHIGRVAAEVKDPVGELMCFYGVGNHGGGPTRENLESISRLNLDPNLPELVLSSPDEFFAAVSVKANGIPVVHDELQHHASGCYSVHSGVKRWNRQAENRLLVAEKLSSLAHRIVNQPYSTELDRAWKAVLFNQFHDILAGTSIEAAYDDARDQYGEALAIADRALNHAAQAIAWKIQINPEEGQLPIVVFNPHAWENKTLVEIEIGGDNQNAILVDDIDRHIPHQSIQSHATANGRSRLSFIAELPAFGYRVFRLVSCTKTIDFPNISASDTVLENERFRLEFDPETGYIRSLFDTTRSLEVFTGDAAVPVVLEDTSDTWSHNIFSFNKSAGQFKASRVRRVEYGPVKSVIRVTSTYGASRMVQDFAMYAGSNAIDVSVTVDWREQFKMLKLRFPLHLAQMKATFEVPYGFIERRTNGEEEPGQSWVDLSGVSRDNGDRYGFSLLNDGKYSFDVNIRDIGMTVLRSPIYAHHMPVEPSLENEYSFIDQGIQRFHYTMLPHDGGWDEAGTVRLAADLNQRPVALVTTIHPGPLAQRGAFLCAEQENLVVTAVKKAQDNDDLIIRVHETAGIETDGDIHLAGWKRRIESHFGPCEIKTFRVPQDEQQPVMETNLLEWQDEIKP
jgi:alpha-mannosidase